MARILVERGRQIFEAPAAFCEFSRDPAADQLLNDLAGHPHAFVIACVMDRQIKAEKAWIIPYELAQRLGGFSFEFLGRLSQEQLQEAFLKPPPLHRLKNVMSQNAFLAIKRIREVYDGDAALIWYGKPSSARVVSRFLAFEGIGPKIATMAANILARELKIPFSDYYSIDVSVDVHVRRVFTRLGLIRKDATPDQVVYQARALHPAFPGLMDLPTFQIGREWCYPTNPRCDRCYMQHICPTALCEQSPQAQREAHELA